MGQIQTILISYCSVSVYYFPTEDDDEDGPTFKDKALEAFKRGIDIFCVWDCCWVWLKFQEWVALLVFDPFVELFITLCIVVNTLFMALDHHDMDKDMEKALKSGNYVRCHYFLNISKQMKILNRKMFTVFHSNICHRSDTETDSNESKVLLSSWMEHFRFYYCSSIVGRTWSGRCTRIVSIAIISFGKKIYLF